MATNLLSISVDLDSSAGETQTAIGPDLERTSQLVAQLLANENLPATWLTIDPSASLAIRTAVSMDSRNEPGLRIADHWSGFEGGRSRLATEFLTRIRRAAASGMTLSTVSMSQSIDREHLELLARHGISAIRGDRASDAGHNSPRSRQVKPNSLRFGLLQIVPVLLWSGGGWFANLLAARRTCRAIDRQIAAGLPTHLVIDCPALAGRNNSGLKGLAKVLRHIGERRGAGAIRAGTITETVARLSARPSARTAKSILRAA